MLFRLLCDHLPTAWGTLGAVSMCGIFVASAWAGPKVSELPVTRVVMFSSGVAFLEHQGQVEDSAEVNLRFNVRDINDLLKSLVVQDLGGGQVSTVSYDSKDPITRTLKTFAVDLTEQPTLADLLRQVRGEEVEIEAPERILGIVVGVEQRSQRVGQDEVIEVSYLNLLTEGGLRSVSLENVGRIKLTNPQLNEELHQALKVLATGLVTDKKTVSLHFLGQGQRPVRVGYIQESPIWKTSYRLVLNDDEQPLLQGWAIVENTSEADWADVELTLVSGRPISFVMDLYEPLYLQRPEVALELFAGLRPRRYDQDLAGREEQLRRAARQRRGVRAQAAAPPPPAEDAFEPEMDMMLRADKAHRDYGESVRSLAEAGDVGELFQYRIDTPVKLSRSQSAMLPIVNEPVQGDKVSIYNESVHDKHPLNGLKLRNTTKLHLMQGPITVFDGQVYAGDAQIQDLAPEGERLISYAMDLDTEVAPESKADPVQLVSVRLVKGTLHVNRKFSRTKTYVVKNFGQRAKQVLIEHPSDPSWKLIEPQEPAEQTRDQYRFALEAEPGETVRLAVDEERQMSETVAVTNLKDQAIRMYLSADAVSDQVKQALAEVVRRQAAIGKVAQQRQAYEQQIEVIAEEQDRIRQNMEALSKNSDLFRRYVLKFTEQEDQIEELRDKAAKAEAEEIRLREELDEFLTELEVQ